MAAVLLFAAPPCAYAAIQGSDLVGTTTVYDRGLTITEAPTVECKSGILCASDGTVLWSRSSDERTAMASTTKMMTAIVALENASADAEYSVSATAASVGESSAGLRRGMKTSLYNLLCGLLIHSGNDAGIAIAEGVAGSVDKFVDMMNDKASQLGLSDTHFTNPHGLDADGHYTTAADLCVIARYGMGNETFRSIVGMKKAKIKIGNKKVTYKSTNSLLNTWKDCLGIKTGYTNAAGYCLASAAARDGRELYAVVLGCSTESERFTDSYALLDWGFEHYRMFSLAKADEPLADVALSGYVDRTVKAGVAEDVNAPALDYDGDISVDIKTMDLPDGVDEGQQVGSVVWRQGEHCVASVPLVAKEKARGPLAVVSVWTALCRLVGVVAGDPCVASGKLYASTIEVKREDDLTGQDARQKMERKLRNASGGTT